jgi:hypothetical protein
MGDLGWESTSSRFSFLRLMFLARIIMMDGNRIVRRVFFWAEKDAERKRKRIHNWVWHSYQLVKRLKLKAHFTRLRDTADGKIQSRLSDSAPTPAALALFKRQAKALKLWRQAVLEAVRRDDTTRFQSDIALPGSKLRTYRLFKSSIALEPYTRLPFLDRRLVAQLRCGAAPLAIETGRWQKPCVPKSQRFCLLCQHDLDENVVEDETHFLINCPSYREARCVLRVRLLLDYGLDLATIPKKDKLKLFLAFPNKLRCVMAFIRQAWRIRHAMMEALEDPSALMGCDLAQRDE